MNETKTVVDTLENVTNGNFETLGGWEENLRFLDIKIINVSDLRGRTGINIKRYEILKN